MLIQTRGAELTRRFTDLSKFRKASLRVHVHARKISYFVELLVFHVAVAVIAGRKDVGVVLHTSVLDGLQHFPEDGIVPEHMGT